MNSMRNWLRRLAITTTLGGALAAALLCGSTANAQGWGGYGGTSSYGYSGSGYGGSGHGHGGSSYRSGYGYGGSGYGGYGARQPHYHAPSMHYDKVYHAETTHWTPGRGLHTHGHYDVVPHYTPGHVHH